MKLVLLAVCVLAVYLVESTPAPATTTAKPKPVEDRVKDLEDVLNGLSRQVMLQQFYLEEKIRSDGSSGIKSVRVNKDGNKNYHAASHLDSRFLVMHDHPNYDRTPGMGELMVVMNGVEFKTRHNDYKLRMPCRNCTDYNKMENIPFPPVPPSVLSKKNVTEAVLEMREYYRAFKEQNITHRDYRPYFKANLCYLEGAWTTGKKLVDPFESDRHSIDASSWFDLMDKARFTSVTGSKSVLENFAFLPTNIQSVEDGKPSYAQWSYRILCHPLKEDLPLKYFEMDDDLAYRFPHRASMDKVGSRAKRFHLNKNPGVDHYNNGRGLLDNLMMQIPGKNNYPAKLYDHSFDMVMEDVRFNNHTLINSGYYNRYFKTMDKGAMGLKSIHRGFSDSNLFVAITDHPQVAPISVNSCHREGTGRNRHQVCKKFTNRMTYALPLEVVYMTPVQTWNPYDLPIYTNQAITTAHNTRNGAPELAKAFNGTNPKKFHFMLPAEFFSMDHKVSGPKDPADTAKRGAGVLDKDGVMRICESSGIRIETPEIEGVGSVRLRYGIMPVHGEGSNMWKELNALKDMTMHLNRYASLFEERPGAAVANGTDESAILHFRVQETIRDPPGEHGHDIFLNNEELDEIKKGHRMTVTTSEDQGHTHELVLQWDGRHHHLKYRNCDGLRVCWDGHSTNIKLIQ